MAEKRRPPDGCQKLTSVAPLAARNRYQSKSVTPTYTFTKQILHPPGCRP